MANEDKSARYHRLRRRTSLLDTTVQVIVLLAIVAGGASIAIRTSAESLVGTALVPVVIAFTSCHSWHSPNCCICRSRSIGASFSNGATDSRRSRRRGGWSITSKPPASHWARWWGRRCFVAWLLRSSPRLLVAVRVGGFCRGAGPAGAVRSGVPAPALLRCPPARS